MEIEELISSGIIELYCMGVATEEEIKKVEKLALQSSEIRFEIMAINEALALYSEKFSKIPSAFVKDKIMEAIAAQEQKIAFPPAINPKTGVEEWVKYLSDNRIAAPENFEGFHVLDLPCDAKQFTYIVWADRGTVVEEAHDDDDEYLLVLKGQCSVTINGKLGYYKEGDIVFIPKKAVHRAEALSDERMLMIGQRIAA